MLVYVYFLVYIYCFWASGLAPSFGAASGLASSLASSLASLASLGSDCFELALLGAFFESSWARAASDSS